MTKHQTLLPLSAAVAVATFAFPAPALADPLPYGPDTCIQGYVWREARTGDTVCVTPEVRARTAQENANPVLNKQPGGGAYGPETCKQGFVWREAFDGDSICVTPEIRAQTLADNGAAQSRYQRNQPQTQQAQSTIVLEVTGSGEVYAIWSDPFGQVAPDHTQIPFSKSFTLPADENYVALTWTSRDDAGKGCKITVDNTVVVEKPLGTTDNCVFTR